MERAFFELIRSAAGDFRFVVISSALAEELQPFVEWRRIRVPRRPFPLGFVLFYVLGALAVSRARRPGRLVHSLGAIVPNRVDVATVQFCHAGFYSATGRLGPPGASQLRRLNTAVTRLLALIAERWSYRAQRATVLAPVSVGTQRELAHHFAATRSVLTPNGVDVGRFHANPEARAELRRELGVADTTVVGVFVGGDWSRKGLREAIFGLAAATRQSSAALELWVVGRGDVARFREHARRAGVERAVRFLGPQRATERYYAAADLLVFPTLYETFSLVAYEAAASGLPLVATKVSGIDELLDHEGGGLVVDRESDAVGAAIARLADDPALRRRLGEEGRRRAEGYSWDRSVESVVGIYDTLMSAAGTGRP
jgi:glycosyltransferase involved in cell wall biosynthesis